MKIFIFGNGKWSKNHQKIFTAHSIPFRTFDLETTPDGAIAEHGEPDAVIITASSVNHHPLTEYFLLRKIPVFCEKPICLERWQLDSLKKIVDQDGILFMAGHQLVFDPVVDRIARDGNAVLYASKRAGAIPRSEGAVMSLAVHDIAVAMHLFKYDADYYLSATGNQHTAQISISWPGAGKTADIYVQSIASVKLRHATIVEHVPRPDNSSPSKVVTTTFSPECWNRTDLLEKELLHFLSCVKNSRQPEYNGFHEAIAVMDATIAARDLLLKTSGA